MSFLQNDQSKFEVPIRGFDGSPFFAEINAEVRNMCVIDEAIKIVDLVRPQKFGPHGLHFYCFAAREHLLNLILRFFDTHKRLPDERELEDIRQIASSRKYFERDRSTIRTKNLTDKTSNEGGGKGWLWLVGLIVAISAAYRFATWLNTELIKNHQAVLSIPLIKNSAYPESSVVRN